MCVWTSFRAGTKTAKISPWFFGVPLMEIARIKGMVPMWIQGDSVDLPARNQCRKDALHVKNGGGCHGEIQEVAEKDFRFHDFTISPSNYRGFHGHFLDYN